MSDPGRCNVCECIVEDKDSMLLCSGCYDDRRHRPIQYKGAGLGALLSGRKEGRARALQEFSYLHHLIDSWLSEAGDDPDWMANVTRRVRDAMEAEKVRKP